MNKPELEEQRSAVPERDRYDLIIIGGGPAGLTAAVYASLLRMRAFLVTSNVGGQTVEGSKIENYMGYEFISGQELVKKFQDQLLQHNYLDHRITEITSVQSFENHFLVTDKREAQYEASAVIIATGMRRRLLNVPGEERLQRQGVFYQHMEEGALVTGHEVAVVGGGNSALQGASELSRICPKVYVVSIGEWTADLAVREEVESLGNVVALKGYAVEEIWGDRRVSAVKVKCQETGKERYLQVHGVFIEIGWRPFADLVSSLVDLNARGEIQIRPDCSTSCPGIFAAGDVTDAFGKRVIIATGEGAKAALSAHEYLMRREKEGM
ncbi:NAD(P)/FAD-dependent oxidoreductase [Candidatus Nitronereus thalassa]|uniref:FAD-dependent oxidoreductase n=1 Tax=Candidatus Nitronereus thalassa TaxID=3020898 RepID=A0ABU3K2Z6_9BACT|nr:FAD-dependent oxidoreductase [Candidatus Nitronereus thalassa]MDT7040760.1 FAD-dependent oxidoreductase [Candidatus Nitronereus thalassa]